MDKYYYPDNLGAQTLFANFWDWKSSSILVALFVISIINVILFANYLFFIVLFIYAVFSAKIANGYSITKLAKLYIHFLLIDKLTFYWR